MYQRVFEHCDGDVTMVNTHPRGRVKMPAPYGAAAGWPKTAKPVAAHDRVERQRNPTSNLPDQHTSAQRNRRTSGQSFTLITPTGPGVGHLFPGTAKDASLGSVNTVARPQASTGSSSKRPPAPMPAAVAASSRPQEVSAKLSMACLTAAGSTTSTTPRRAAVLPRCPAELVGVASPSGDLPAASQQAAGQRQTHAAGGASDDRPLPRQSNPEPIGGSGASRWAVMRAATPGRGGHGPPRHQKETQSGSRRGPQRRRETAEPQFRSALDPTCPCPTTRSTPLEHFDNSRETPTEPIPAGNVVGLVP